MNRVTFFVKSVLLTCMIAATVPVAAQFVPDTWTIPMRGNSYITRQSEAAAHPDSDNRNAALAIVGQGGLILKNDTQSIASAYVYIPAASCPRIALNVVGSARMDITCGTERFVKDVSNKKMGPVTLGRLNIAQPQYIRIDFKIRGTDKPSYVVVRDIILAEMPTKPLYVTPNYDARYGLRGSSIMLNYNADGHDEAEWAYAELTIPSYGDAPGSNYCALGFDGGMLGFRYGKKGKKVAALSVWNAMKDESFGDVPPEYRAKVIDKGNGVKAVDFGVRKEGKRCSLDYPWETAKAYSFLLHARHGENDSTTTFTAYVYDSTEAKWTKIATVQRPFTGTLVTGLCSYLENIDAEKGYLMRKCYIGNVMLRGKDQAWHSIREAAFSNDDTGRRGIRVDYGGGVETGRFYMVTGGYFGNGAASQRHLSLPRKDMKATVKWINEEITKLK